MSYMFYEATAFNQPIGNWNTTAVTDMSYMFGNASAFNQKLCWEPPANATEIFGGSGCPLADCWDCVSD
jgi:surface protein